MVLAGGLHAASLLVQSSCSRFHRLRTCSCLMNSCCYWYLCFKQNVFISYNIVMHFKMSSSLETKIDWYYKTIKLFCCCYILLIYHYNYNYNNYYIYVKILDIFVLHAACITSHPTFMICV